MSKRLIGQGQPVYFIAEAGVNHNGDLALAHRLIDVAAAAKADAVKFQTFRAEALVSPKARKAEYQSASTGAGSQMEMLKALELAEPAWKELKAHCDEAGIAFLSTPFDEGSCDLLVEISVDAIKLGSGDLTNKGLIQHISRTGLPLLLSTGMGTRPEVSAAVSWFHKAFEAGSHQVAESGIGYADGGRLGLLHCVSSYPAPDEALNLRAIETMAAFTRLSVGYSDHSVGIDALPIAVAAGAVMLEKHFTTDRTLPGPDHQASLEPEELANAVQKVRRVEMLLGHGRKEPHPCEEELREVARRSLTALRDIAAGVEIQA
ncbi:MAG: N-acetylneuraminate synthase family protein, partial [Planctomycetes bacterium]|nr:N-acetylneuraminate synthase family protein [Planctomycetota bacterium]